MSEEAKAKDGDGEEAGLILELKQIGDSNHTLTMPAEAVAEILERVGKHQEAAVIRGEKYEHSMMQRAKNVWNYSPSVGDLVLVVSTTGAAWLVYQGVRYLLRNTIDLPSLGGWEFNQQGEAVASVRRIRTAAA